MERLRQLPWYNKKGCRQSILYETNVETGNDLCSGGLLRYPWLYIPPCLMYSTTTIKKDVLDTNVLP